MHAELDTGTYPTGEKVSDEQMGDLPLDRHRCHGDWNYTLHPRPLPRAPAAPAPAARPARYDQATLTHPALTGISRPDLERLATALALPRAARQEAQRYQWRGGPRRQAPGAHGRPALDLTSQIAVTLIHQHLHLPQHVIAWLTATSPDTISTTIKTISPLLPRHPARTTPAPPRLRTPGDLIRYATAAGITLPPGIKPACQ